MKVYHGSYTEIETIELADTSNQLFQKTWQEIYEILKVELKNDNN